MTENPPEMIAKGVVLVAWRSGLLILRRRIVFCPAFERNFGGTPVFLAKIWEIGYNHNVESVRIFMRVFRVKNRLLLSSQRIFSDAGGLFARRNQDRQISHGEAFFVDKGMGSAQELIQRLNQSGKKLSKSHRRIAECIVTHYDKAAFMTASRLGEYVGVSESTVVRFASTLGYEGYPQLQKALQELIRHRLTASQRFEMTSDMDQTQVLGKVLKADMQNIRTTIDELDTAVFENVIEQLLRAKTIYVLGLRASAPLAQFMTHYLDFIFSNVVLVTSGVNDVFEQLSRIGEDDVLIGISFPRYSSRTMEAMEYAKSHGAQLVAITDGPLSPLHALADLCLTAKSDMASFVDSLVAPLSLINALIVALGQRRRQQVAAYFDEMEHIWDEYRVYLGKDKPANE